MSSPGCPSAGSSVGRAARSSKSALRSPGQVGECAVLLWPRPRVDELFRQTVKTEGSGHVQAYKTLPHVAVHKDADNAQVSHRRILAAHRALTRVKRGVAPFLDLLLLPLFTAEALPTARNHDSVSSCSSVYAGHVCVLSGSQSPVGDVEGTGC